MSDDPGDPLPNVVPFVLPIGERVTRAEQILVFHDQRLAGVEGYCTEFRAGQAKIDTELHELNAKVDAIKNGLAAEKVEMKDMPTQIASKWIVYFLRNLTVPVVVAIVVALLTKYL
jgi:hypothetical protein